jgi:hypothetical protein
MNPLALVPAPYRILAILALLAATMGFGWVKGAYHVQSQWDAAEGKRVAAVALAYQTRIAANQAQAAKQAASNATIQKGKDDEITALNARLAVAGRLRVGTAICGGPATTAEASSTASGDGADSPGRLVREDVDRDFKALILAVETDLATGGACQAFIRENGLVP